MTTRIAIATEQPGWHGERLRQAFAARGVDSRFVSLRACALHLGSSHGLVLPGFAKRPPDAVFVRGVAGGSLEEVVFQLNVLHALGAAGIPVYNDGRAIERSVDKAFTSFTLARAGIATPATWVTGSPAEALRLAARHASARHPLVCKPLFGSQGQGLRLLRDPGELPGPEAVGGVWYLQAFVGDPAAAGRDWRVLVAGGRAVSAMQRRSDGWLTNVARGGRCHPALPEGEAARLAVRAAAVLDMAYAGVDLVQDPDGRWSVLEVNSVPAWRGLQAVTHLDIAGLLADQLLCRIRAALAEAAP